MRKPFVGDGNLQELFSLRLERLAAPDVKLLHRHIDFGIDARERPLAESHTQIGIIASEVLEIWADSVLTKIGKLKF